MATTIKYLRGCAVDFEDCEAVQAYLITQGVDNSGS